MSEEAKISNINTLKELSHNRILWLMGLVIVLGMVLSFILKSFIFGLGVLLGGVLAFINYYWLKKSLKSIFSAAENGEKPKVFGGNYILRYIVFALIIALIYVSNSIPIVAILLGLLSFAVAVMFEGVLRIFSSFIKKEEIQ